MSAYPNVRFLISADRPGQFVPDSGAEVAVAGRSNAGKSTAINALTQRKSLARTSKRPGATRLINFFELEPGRRLVDLPGYGYAAVAGEQRRHWGQLVDAYFRSRRSLRGVIVVMDIRHPLSAHDREMLELARQRDVPVHVLLTKADKLGRGAIAATGRAVTKELGPAVSVQAFSALSGAGVNEARRRLDAWLAGREPSEVARPGLPQKETPVGPAEPTGED
jgi:GTP-binding protein